MSSILQFEINKFVLKRDLARLGAREKSYCCALFIDLQRSSDIFATIKNLPKKSLVIVRQYHLQKQEREAFAREILRYAKKFGHQVLIGKDAALALKIGADGVHFSDRESTTKKFINKKFVRRNFLVSLACHSVSSILKAQKSQAEILFLSPIFATKSHEDTKALGLNQMARACFLAKGNGKKIFALGGIDAKKIAAVRKVGASGFGGVGVFEVGK